MNVAKLTFVRASSKHPVEEAHALVPLLGDADEAHQFQRVQRSRQNGTTAVEVLVSSSGRFRAVTTRQHAGGAPGDPRIVHVATDGVSARVPQVSPRLGVKA